MDHCWPGFGHQLQQYGCLVLLRWLAQLAEVTAQVEVPLAQLLLKRLVSQQYPFPSSESALRQEALQGLVPQLNLKIGCPSTPFVVEFAA